MLKLKYCVCALLLSSFSPLLQALEPLSQAQYDQQIQYYTDIVNQTKKVIDVPDSIYDAKTQNIALCQRIEAYRQIATLSEANISLDLASIMLSIANNYLAQQQQSFAASKMTEQAFCPSKKTDVKPLK